MGDSLDCCCCKVCVRRGERGRGSVCMSVGGCGCDCISMEVCVGETALITAVKYV